VRYDGGIDFGICVGAKVADTAGSVGGVGVGGLEGSSHTPHSVKSRFGLARFLMVTKIASGLRSPMNRRCESGESGWTCNSCGAGDLGVALALGTDMLHTNLSQLLLATMLAVTYLHSRLCFAQFAQQSSSLRGATHLRYDGLAVSLTMVSYHFQRLHGMQSRHLVSKVGMKCNLHAGACTAHKRDERALFADNSRCLL
jgi:hypothetical protein